MSYSTLGSKVVSETPTKEPLALRVYVSGHPIFQRNSIWGPLQINKHTLQIIAGHTCQLDFQTRLFTESSASQCIQVAN